MFVMANRAEVNRLHGIDSRLIGPDGDQARWRRACTSARTATYPIMGALYHPPGGIIRHDAVVWGFARGADEGGAEIHPYTRYRPRRAGDRITAVQTNRGTVEAGTVLSCTAGWCTLVATWPESRCRSRPTSCRRA